MLSVPVWSQFGDSGGVRNESDVPIRLKIISENGDYEWQQLSPGVSLDFHEEVSGTGFYSHSQHPINSRTRIRIVLYHPNGSLQTLDKLEDFIPLVRYQR